MRLFIAVEISDEIKYVLVRVISRLRYAGADIKWAEPKSMHLTVKFLGDVDESRFGEVAAIMDEAAAPIRPFHMMLNDIGGFPSSDTPKVLWAGLGDGASEAADVAARLDDAFSKIGIAKESRPFKAHLTLGRARTVRNIDKLKSMITSAASVISEASGLSQKVNSLILFRSELTPHGAVHTKIHESLFSG